MLSLLAPIAMPILRFATRSYITGPQTADAIDVARAAGERGMAATLCYWNEDKEEPRRVAERYLDTLAAMHAAGLDGHLAVKIPALGDRGELVAEVVDRARQLGHRVVFDSHAPEASEVTFTMLMALGPEGVGCAVPGRWIRSLRDVEQILALGISVRVVKGQWADPLCPDLDLRRGFMELIDRLSGHARHVGVATHDAPLAREALNKLVAAGTPCELELLYGLPIGPASEAARELGVKVRLYIPFGTAWLPYSVSRTLENPRVLLWLARDLFKGRGVRRRRPARAGDAIIETSRVARCREPVERS